MFVQTSSTINLGCDDHYYVEMILYAPATDIPSPAATDVPATAATDDPASDDGFLGFLDYMDPDSPMPGPSDDGPDPMDLE